MTQAEKTARALIAKRSTAELVGDFETTETQNDEHIPTVRGWLMDELEKRSPEAFEKWLDAYTESPREYFKGIV